MATGRKPPERALVLAWVARTRSEQGLPPMLMDEVVIGRVVSILRGARRLRKLAADGPMPQTQSLPDNGRVTSR